MFIYDSVIANGPLNLSSVYYFDFFSVMPLNSPVSTVVFLLNSMKCFTQRRMPLDSQEGRLASSSFFVVVEEELMMYH